jgi:hypothetical protein
LRGGQTGPGTGGVPRPLTAPSGQDHPQPRCEMEGSVRSLASPPYSLRNTSELPPGADPPSETPPALTGCTGAPADGEDTPQDHMEHLHLEDLAEDSLSSEPSQLPDKAQSDWMWTSDTDWEGDAVPACTATLKFQRPEAAATGDRHAAPGPAGGSQAGVRAGPVDADQQVAAPVGESSPQPTTKPATRLRGCSGEADPVGTHARQP